MLKALPMPIRANVFAMSGFCLFFNSSFISPMYRLACAAAATMNAASIAASDVADKAASDVAADRASGAARAASDAEFRAYANSLYAAYRAVDAAGVYTAAARAAYGFAGAVSLAAFAGAYILDKRRVPPEG